MATTTLRIGPADQGRAMTLDEFLDAEEEPGYCYELARGVLEVTEVRTTRTRRSSGTSFALCHSTTRGTLVSSTAAARRGRLASGFPA